MRAVRRTERGIEVVDVPRSSQPDGTTVKVSSVGICGSDLTLAKAGPLKAVLGHEVSGVLGDGTAVAIEPMAPCGECDQCAIGRYHLCKLGARMLIGIGIDGGMAEELTVPQRSVVPLPPGLPVEDACLVEPLAVCVHGLRIAGLEPGSRVGVFGAGSIGLCAAAAAASYGCTVGLASRHPHQTKVGEAFGAGPIEGTYDLVVEAAGTAGALEEAVRRCRPGGTVVVLGAFWESLPVPAVDATMKELRILPSFTYNRSSSGKDIDTAASLLASRPQIATELITHRFPLDEAPRAFAVAADKSQGAIKVVMEP